MGLLQVEINTSSIDYVVFAGHKTLYAPFGVSGFICKTDINLNPLVYGGTGIDSANRDLPETLPERYEAGSINIMSIAGLNAALKWIEKVGISNILKSENDKRTMLLNTLSSFDNICIVPKANITDVVSIISCVFDSFGSDIIGRILSDNGIAVRTGLHCAPEAHRYLGTFPNGTVRFSVGFFNEDKCFIQLQKALNHIYDNS
jgi:selenocysteine lyase/cysteine desulfurase